MGKRDGYTLVEVVISILLTSVLVSAVFSVALSMKSGGGKADRKLLGGQAVQALTDELKAYAADTTNNFAGSAATISGPNWRARGAKTAASWHIFTPGVQEDRQCTLAGAFGTKPTVSGTGQDIYALASASSAPAAPGGLHCLVCVAAPTGGADSACFLPSLLRNAPYNGVIYYQVSATSPPQVQVGVYWDEP